MEGRHRLQDPSAATPAAALAAPDDPLHRPARRLSRPQIRWRAGNPDPVARPPANGRHHRRLSQLPHRLRHAAINRPTARTPPRDPNNRQQTAYSSLSDADLWGKIRTKSGHGDPLWLHRIAASQLPPIPRTALQAMRRRRSLLTSFASPEPYSGRLHAPRISLLYTHVNG